MFDLDHLSLSAAPRSSRTQATKPFVEFVARAVSAAGQVLRGLANRGSPGEADLSRPELTILNVVWAP